MPSLLKKIDGSEADETKCYKQKSRVRNGTLARDYFWVQCGSYWITIVPVRVSIFYPINDGTLGEPACIRLKL